MPLYLRRRDKNQLKELNEAGAEFDPEQTRNIMTRIDQRVRREKALFPLAAGLTFLYGL